MMLKNLILWPVLVFALSGCVDGGYSMHSSQKAPRPLSGLQLSIGALTPDFDTSVSDYTVVLPFASTSMDFSLLSETPDSTFKINGQSVLAGEAKTLALTLGDNPVVVEVTAADGTVKTYNIVAKRKPDPLNLTGLALSSGELTPGFATATLNYSVLMSDVPPNFTVTPTAADPETKIEINFNGSGFSEVSSGVASAALTPATPLPSNNTLEVRMTFGGQTRTYSVAITYGVCAAGMYSNGVNACVPVGAGWWSPANDNGRTACSNKPATNARYTSPTAKTLNCPWTCDDGYLSNGSACVANPDAVVLSCADDEVGVGLWGRSGAIIDRLGVLCAKFEDGQIVGPVRQGPHYGGMGGGPFTNIGPAACPADHALYQVEGDLGTFGSPSQDRTGRIRYVCKHLTSGVLVTVKPTSTDYWGSGATRGSFSFHCGDGVPGSPYEFGEFLNGIIIRKGLDPSYTSDTLGVTCR
ncbi:MAG: cadherin-like beta sandwich domain-containing protein [Bdellovibrionaceae bacterium]|nr:cadherin-like beta sandwich domain-containing protein [Pseudobdellovibrionaceae bacterium]